jgi:hypothetical protein
MTNLKTLAVAAALLGAAAPAFAQSQLVANAGLTPAEAAGLSLNEIAVAKFNRGSDSSERQVTFTPASGGNSAQLAASAGLAPDQAQSLTLTEIAAAKFNRDASASDAQRVQRPSGVTQITRSLGTDGRSQLVAAAGLSQDEANGLSLTEIARAKFDRATDN